MDKYLSLLKELYKPDSFQELYINTKGSRVNITTSSKTFASIEHSLAEGFPLLTTKKVFFKYIVVELLWLLSAKQDISFLKKHNVKIWDEWATSKGHIGPTYGTIWRTWDVEGNIVDQLKNAISCLQSDLDTRRAVVSSWDVGRLEHMALHPCPIAFQFLYNSRYGLDCIVYQRSCDIFLGLPFDICTFTLLNMIVASILDVEASRTCFAFGDLHLYHNHFEQANIQLARQPYKLPTVKIRRCRTKEDIDTLELGDFELIDYQSHSAIKAPLNV